mmetsp:Transcript_55494/g.180096  ORF Transcript_55494/g.180096 Transcript_55494/m.180096 type:complete len:267 (-) Transcript_55494:285-1085(-)
MPVELWLECALDRALLRHLEDGGRLVAVGNCPALGNWSCIGKAPVLTLSEEVSADRGPIYSLGRAGPDAERRCHFRLGAPVRLAEEPADLPYTIEYTYLILSKDGTTLWEEDLGDYEPLPRFGGGAEDCGRPLDLAPARRKLFRSLQRPWTDSVLLRVDVCGSTSGDVFAVGALGAAVFQGVWQVSPDWDPMVAGCSAAVGALFPALGTCAPPGPVSDADGGEATALALHLFVHARRSRLLGALRQLARKARLPADVWRYVGDCVG